MNKKECKHKRLSLEYIAYYEYIYDEGDGYYHKNDLQDLTFNESSNTAVYCMDCGKYLSENEVSNIDIV